MDCQLNSRIECVYLDKIHSKRPFVFADWKTIMFRKSASVRTHFGRIFIAASIIASSFCRNCWEDTLSAALSAVAFNLFTS